MGLHMHRVVEDRVIIYARDPQDILSFVNYYRGQAEARGVSLDDPRLAKWLAIPTLGDIVAVEQGRLNFHVGMLNLRGKGPGDVFSEHLQVTPDFIVAATPESIVFFDAQRQGLPAAQRDKLYKFTVDNALFGATYYVPEDVMRGMVDFDLTPYLARAIGERGYNERVMRDHPHMRPGCSVTFEPLIEEDVGPEN